jgi:signal transduction histidine kinase
MLQTVQRNSAELKHIIDELLDLAALDTGAAELTFGPVDLAAVVRDAITDNPELHGGSFTVSTDLPQQCTVHGDAGRLRQVAGALISNAIAYRPDGGDIAITITAVGGRMVDLTVADHGIGIPESERDKVFTRFYRSSRTRDRRIPGAGLALAICRAIIERHRGSITLQPTTGPGTTVRIRLPRDYR